MFMIVIVSSFTFPVRRALTSIAYLSFTSPDCGETSKDPHDRHGSELREPGPMLSKTSNLDALAGDQRCQICSNARSADVCPSASEELVSQT